jgi:hypothetical protein
MDHTADKSCGLKGLGFASSFGNSSFFQVPGAYPVVPYVCANALEENAVHNNAAHKTVRKEAVRKNAVRKEVPHRKARSAARATIDFIFIRRFRIVEILPLPRRRQSMT